MVKGKTRHRLDEVRTLDINNPYIVGVNGVNDIFVDSDGVENVRYTIGDIQYLTKLIKIIDPDNPYSVSLNSTNNISKPYVPNRYNNNDFEEIYPTTFVYTPIVAVGGDDDSYFIFKEESKSGVVFKPKIKEEVFIDRKPMSVFENQFRLSNIKSLEGLERYNNGYYNIFKEE